MVGLFDIFSRGLREKRSNRQKMAGLPEGRVKMESKKVRICAIFLLKTCSLFVFAEQITWHLLLFHFVVRIYQKLMQVLPFKQKPHACINSLLFHIRSEEKSC